LRCNEFIGQPIHGATLTTCFKYPLFPNEVLPRRNAPYPRRWQIPPASRRAPGLQGIGPIISNAMVAAIGAGDVFSKGRDFAAWLGLVPKQISTGDRTILGKISKRGNRYLRVLFVQAAWVVLIKPKSWELAQILD
jgi:transposase